MKHKFRFIISLLSLLISQSVIAYDFEVDGIYYNKLSDGKSVGVTYRYSSSYGSGSYSGAVSIPSIVTYDGTTYSVTSIGEYAFHDCSGLTSVEIPNSVTTIGAWAFYGCTGLTSVEITDLAAWCKIRFDSPLYYAHNLYLNGKLVTDLVIPDSVTSIGKYAFYGCSGLTSVEIPNSVTSIGNYAFNYCSGLTSVVIPNSVTEIGWGAFQACSGLTSVEIPNSVTTIGKYAFHGCSGLTSVVIPNSVTTIGECAFAYCSGLTSVEIPNSVTSIGEYAFSGCSGLTYFYGKFASEDNRCLIDDGWLMSFAPAGLTYYKIPSSVTGIGSAFYGCTSLTSVEIPNSVTWIADYAFYNCM